MGQNSNRFFFPAAILLLILPPEPLIIKWAVLLPFVLVLAILVFLCRSGIVRQAVTITLFVIIVLLLRDQRFSLLHFISTLNIPETDYSELTGTISSQIQPWQEDGFTFQLRSHSIQFHKKTIDTAVRYQVRLAKGPLPAGMARGAVITIAAQLAPLGERHNFALPDRRMQLLARGIYGLASCKSAGLITVITPAPLPWALLHSWRLKMTRAIDELPLPRDIGNLVSPLFKSVFLGHPFQGDPDIRHQFMMSGALHLLAISGTHIALITGFIFFFFTWLPCGLRRSLCAVIILFYLMQAAAPISAQRAAIIAWAWLWSSHRKRELNLTHVLGLSGAFDLIINPFIVFSPAFILSYSICFALAFWAERLGYRQGNTAKKPLIMKAWILLKTQWLALMASAPLTLHFFNQTTVNAIPAGMLLIPLFGLLLPLAAITLLLFMLIPASITIMGALLTPVISLFQTILQLFSHGDFLLLYRQAPALWILPVYLGFLFYAGRSSQNKGYGRWVSLIPVFTLFIYLLLPDTSRQPQSTEVHIPNIGQGEIHAIVFPSGKSMLIDCGGAPFSDQRSVTELVTAYLLNNRIHPEWIAISHFHSDHCGTLPGLIRIFKPQRVFFSEQPKENSLFVEAVNRSPDQTRWIPAQKGLCLTVDDVRLIWLYPEQMRPADSQTSNGHSQVIRLETPSFSMLFCGDIGIQEESILIDHTSTALSSTILKVPHHGSKSSSSSPFLKAVSPQLSIFHCARHNSFSFPHPTVLSRYRQLGIPSWRTWQGGLIASADQNGLRIKTASGQLIRKLRMFDTDPSGP